MSQSLARVSSARGLLINCARQALQLSCWTHMDQEIVGQAQAVSHVLCAWVMARTRFTRGRRNARSRFGVNYSIASSLRERPHKFRTSSQEYQLHFFT